MGSKHKNKNKNNTRKSPSVSVVLALIALIAVFTLIPAWGWILMILGCLFWGGWKKKSK